MSVTPDLSKRMRVQYDQASSNQLRPFSGSACAGMARNEVSTWSIVILNKEAIKLWPLFVATLVTSGIVTMRAQSALDGFDPNANGPVRVIVIQPDGKILISGESTSVARPGGPAVTHSNSARFTADGRLDTSFSPNANNIVNSIAVQTDGKI